MAERSKPITILLADDHPVVRQGLRSILETQADFEVIGETADGLEGLRLVKQLKPDILVADISMPGLNGLDVTKQVTQFSSHTRVIILSMHSTEAFVAEALKNGAAGYVLKDSTPTSAILGAWLVHTFHPTTHTSLHSPPNTGFHYELTGPDNNVIVNGLGCL